MTKINILIFKIEGKKSKTVNCLNFNAVYFIFLLFYCPHAAVDKLKSNDRIRKIGKYLHLKKLKRDKFVPIYLN